jgi:hypothetical protein
LGASASLSSGALSNVTPNTCPTSPAVAANTSFASTSCPLGAPSGCSALMRIAAPSVSMWRLLIGSGPTNGASGGAAPENPVTIRSPGEKIGSAALIAVPESASAVSAADANLKA